MIWEIKQVHMKIVSSTHAKFALVPTLWNVPQLWNICGILANIHVATIALGSQPRQGVVRLLAKREARESCHMLLGVQESVKG